MVDNIQHKLSNKLIDCVGQNFASSIRGTSDWSLFLLCIMNSGDLDNPWKSEIHDCRISLKVNDSILHFPTYFLLFIL